MLTGTCSDIERQEVILSMGSQPMHDRSSPSLGNTYISRTVGNHVFRLFHEIQKGRLALFGLRRPCQSMKA